MHSLFIVTLVVLAGVCLAADNSMLKCFDCIDCDDHPGTPKTCSRDENTCMKIVAGDHVIKRCAQSNLCGLGKAERASNRVWAALSNAFKDVDEDAQLVYCCDDEYCNSGFQMLPNLLVLLLPLIFVSLFKF